MKKEKYPILEYDRDRKALIEPGRRSKKKHLSNHCVICFFEEVIRKLTRSGRLKVIGHLKSEMGKHLIYELKFKGKRLKVIHSAVGAPLAAGFLEEMIARGSSKIIACGGAGVLEKGMTIGKIVIPSSAVRDEGTSYHYLPPGREVIADKKGIRAIEKTLKKYGIEYIIGKTWTTDGFYRETAAKIRARRDEGCITVEMETAAFLAVARFRKVIFGQMLYSGDDLSGGVHDHRQWDRCSVREELFWFSCESCLAL
jgi:uridine phosphorylase